MNPRFTYYKRYRNTTTKSDINFERLTSKISSDINLRDTISDLRLLSKDPKPSKRSQSDLTQGLNNLPGFTPSCLIYNGDRREINSRDAFLHTNLLCINLTYSEKLASDLKDDKHVRLYYRSPLGKELTVLFQVSGIRTSETHESAYEGLINYCRARNYAISSKGLDYQKYLETIQHISYDPDLHFKESISLELDMPEDIEFEGMGDKIQIPLQQDTDTLQTVIEHHWSELERSEPTLYSQNDILHWLDKEEKAFKKVTIEGLDRWLAERFFFTREKSTQHRSWTEVSDDIPLRLVRNLLDSSVKCVPKVTSIYHHPIYLPNTFEAITEPGYCERNQSYIFCDEGIDYVNLDTSDKGIESAKSLLMDDLLGDFLFTSAGYKENYLAFLLLFPLRPAIEDNIPLLSVSSPMRGAGKTKLFDIAHRIWIGEPIEAITLEEDFFSGGAEFKKLITSLLIEMPEMLLFDNITKLLDNSALAATLTSQRRRDRILGESKTVSMPVKAIIGLTGTNLQLGTDMTRRTYWVRLTSDRPDPDNRENFKYLLLENRASEHRKGYMEACLTLIKSWIESGMPTGKVIKGSFTTWSQIISGILTHIGYDQFELTTEIDESDTENPIAALTVFAAKVYETHGNTSLSTGDLYSIATTNDTNIGILDRWIGDGSIAEQRRKIRLGKHLSAHDGYIFKGYRLDRDKNKKYTAHYIVSALDSDPAETEDLFTQSQSTITAPKNYANNDDAINFGD